MMIKGHCICLGDIVFLCLVRLYQLYNHWGMQVLIYLFIIVDLGLAVFEEPAVIPDMPIWVYC